MKTITPFLWFDSEAEEAAKLYVSLFEDSKMGAVAKYSDAGPGPAGSVMTVAFKLCGQEFGAINGGPIFKLTPAISFFVSCETEEQLEKLWAKLSDGGKVLMEKQKYPFSEKYGWLNDKYGVSWQLMLANTKQKIAPELLFVGKHYAKAEEAINFYLSVFPKSKLNMISRNGPGTKEKEGTVQYANFLLNGQEFNAMEGATGHTFDFTEAISFAVHCETQDEIDLYWNKLSAVKEAEQCGWLKDKYGISWQIVPKNIAVMMADKDSKKSERMSKAMFSMKKLDMKALQDAFDGK